MQELCLATDNASQAMKVAAEALGEAMSVLVVQKRHLLLNLVEMWDAENVHFLDDPISQGGLFGDTVQSCDPAGEECNKAKVRVLQTVLHHTQETWWVTADLGSPCLEPGPPQAPIQEYRNASWCALAPKIGLQ